MNAYRSIRITAQKSQVQMNQTFQLKIRYSETDRKESGNSIECIGIGESFLNRRPIVQSQRLTVNKWDVMKLKNFCKEKDTVYKTK